MLRPPVAATNCVRAGNASGLDIFEALPIVLKTCFLAVAPIQLRCPGGIGASTRAGDGLITVMVKCLPFHEAGLGVASRPIVPKWEFFCPGPVQLPDKTSPFLRISKVFL